jgi:hypothetical protein|tara:strand:+ start:567 stop:851 length:285 start_codon:yes stop_codon:yes gene_type:complete
VEEIMVLMERFGLPTGMLAVVSYAIIKLFQWMSGSLMKQIADNHNRIESIIIKLIDNSKEEREQNRQNMNEILSRMDTTINIMAKLTGNGLKEK